MSLRLGRVLALAMGQTSAAAGKKGRVIATEYEAAKAREYWAECVESVEKWIELREGDILETLKEDLGDVDLLLLDSKFDAQWEWDLVWLTKSSLVCARSSNIDDRPS